MHATSPTEQRLLAENVELVARLAEAEETLRAIRSGEVDALVVESSAGPRVFTLQGADAESNRFRGEILAQVSDAVIATGPDQRVIYFNPAAERRYGVTGSEALGRRLTEIYQWRWLQPGDETAALTALDEQGEWHGQNIHVLRDGRELHVESSVTVLRDGAISGLLAVIRDVSERQKAQEALASQRRLHQSVTDNASGALFIIDNTQHCVFMNPAAEQLTGYAFEETRGRTLHDVVHHTRPNGSPYPLSECPIDRDYPARNRAQGEEVFVHKDGRFYNVAFTASPMHDERGTSVGTIIEVQDITQRKQMEQSLRDVDRRKDEFLATLAHELRNPLAPMRYAAQFLQAKEAAKPELQWARDVINRQVEQMTRLIDDLLDVSRINQGKIELMREPVELAAVVQGALETSRPLITQMDHDLAVTLPPGPVIVDADLTRLAQVFANLLNNAAKYTERGGRIDLRAEQQGSDVVVSVRDTGIGIPTDKLATIFEMFSQVEGALSRSQGGLGVGLCLVKRLVELHGGRVDARSDGLGKGSEFVVRLPIVTEQAYLRKASDNQAKPTSHLRILVVEDNRDAAESLAMLLTFMGNEVRTAHDGEEAVRMAGEFRPQVVLCDLGLPKVNGYEACRRMREHAWSEKMVVIALTGWGQDADRAKSEAAGFDHHMVKPVDPQTLMKFLSGLDAVKV